MGNRISVSKFEQVNKELRKRLGTFLHEHHFSVPETNELNFAFIKRDMAKLKKGISNIVDEIIKENEPPEDRPIYPESRKAHYL